MPVLPLVASSRLRPASSPFSSAAATIADAARSFTDPPGLTHSAFPNSEIPGRSAVSRSRRNRGVLPTRSRMPVPSVLDAELSSVCSSVCIILTQIQRFKAPTVIAALGTMCDIKGERNDQCIVHWKIEAIARQPQAMRTKLHFLSFEEILSALRTLEF